MPIPKLLVLVSFLSLLVLPEWYSPIGRLGLEILLVGVTLALLVRTVTVDDLMRIAPISLPSAAFLLSFCYAIGFAGAPIFGGGLHTIASWARCIVLGLWGLYLGHCLRFRDFAFVVQALLSCTVVVFLFGFLQIFSALARDVTFMLYWPSVDEGGVDWSALLASRPSSTTGRVFSFAFFACFMFLALLAGITRRTLVRNLSIGIAALVALLATQTKWAVLAAFVGLLALPVETLRRSTVIVTAVSAVLLGGVIVAAVSFSEIQRLAAFALLLSGDFTEFVTVLMADPNVVVRLEYLEIQWGIFLSEPLLGDMYRANEAAFSDNLYFDTLAKGGIVGLAAVLSIPLYFWRLFVRFRRAALERPELADHMFVARCVLWAGFVAVVMGVTWNLFTGHRTALLVYFLCGILEGQWVRLVTENVVRIEPTRSAKFRFVRHRLGQAPTRMLR